MQKNIWKKLIVLLVVIAIAGSVAGCANLGEVGGTGEEPVASGSNDNNSSTTPAGKEEKELITFTMAVNTQTPDCEASHVAKYIEENFKIKLKIDEYNSENWNSQLTLMFASDELPDIISNTGMDFSKFNEYANDEYFLPISDYMDLMPNLQRILAEYPSYGQIMTNVDGKIYGLSQLTTINQNAPARGFINENWLSAVGKEVPRSVDKLYDVLVAFKEQDANGNGDANDEIPMYLDGGYNGRNNTFRILANAFGILSDNPTGKMCVDENGKIYAPWSTDNWKDFLKYLNKLYEEELIDTNYVVRTSEEFKQMVAEDRVGMFGANAPFAQAGKNISYDANFQYTHPMTSAYMDKATLVTTSGASTKVSLAINANTEHAERIFELINWIYTVDGALGVGMGVQGMDWDYIYTDYSDKYGVLEMRCPEGYANSNDYKIKACIINGAFSLYSPAEGRWYKIVDEVDDDTLYNDEALIEKNGWFVLVEQGIREADVIYESLTTMVYTNEEGGKRASLVTDIKSYVEQMTTEFITGERNFETGWDEYVKTLNQMRIDEWVEIDQVAYDRMNR